MGTDIDMGVSLTGVPYSKKLFSKLPDLDLINGEGWDFIDEQRWTRPDGTEHTQPGYFHQYGQGRYGDAENIEAWAKKFTAKHPEATVEFTQEWWGDGENQTTLDVYRAGELVRAESKVSQLVPLDLHAMLATAKSAIADWDEAVEGPSGDAEAAAGYDLRHALEALVKGLS